MKNDDVLARGKGDKAVVWIVGLVLVAVGTLYVLNALDAEYPWINHDVGYHTYLGMEMARGTRLYVDLEEDNPPGSPLMLGAIFAVADRIGVPDFAAQNLFVLALGLAGFGVLWFAVGRTSQSWLWPLTALAYLLVVIRGGFSNSLYPDAPGIPYDFGQREHMFSMLFLPYVLARINRDRFPWWFLLFAGLLGWVAIFKPFWPPLLLLVEVFARRRRRVAQWKVPAVLFGVMVLPFVGLALHSPGAFVHFLTRTIPMYFRGGYDFYQESSSVFLSSGLHVQMLAALLVWLAASILAVRCEAVRPSLAGLFLALIGLAYAVVWYQGRFWSYHTMLFFALTVVSAAYCCGLFVARLQRQLVPRLVGGTFAAVLLVLSATTVAGTAKMLTRFPPLGSFLCPVVRHYDRVMYFSMSAMVQYPPLKLRQQMIGPWTVFVDLPELLALPDGEERERRLEGYAAKVRETIERERPELLVFSPEPQALPAGTTLHGLLQDIDALPLEAYRPVSAGALGGTDPWLDEWLFYQRADIKREPGL